MIIAFSFSFACFPSVGSLLPASSKESCFRRTGQLWVIELSTGLSMRWSALPHRLTVPSNESPQL